MNDLTPEEIFELQKQKMLNELEKELRDRERKRFQIISLVISVVLAFITIWGAPLLVSQIVEKSVNAEIKKVDVFKLNAAKTIGETEVAAKIAAGAATEAAKFATSAATEASKVAKEMTTQINGLSKQADDLQVTLKIITDTQSSEIQTRVQKTANLDELKQQVTTIQEIIKTISKAAIFDDINLNNKINKLVSESENLGKIIKKGGEKVARNSKYLISIIQVSKPPITGTNPSELYRNLTNDGYLVEMATIRREHFKEILDDFTNHVVISKNTTYTFYKKAIENIGNDVAPYGIHSYSAHFYSIDLPDEKFEDLLKQTQRNIKSVIPAQNISIPANLSDLRADQKDSSSFIKQSDVLLFFF